ncbi:MAG: hypothetical protein M1834_002073 [Cirrosporium novae-zelandiae]|nr:MAG: hypothetical protein M1834_002073 [Cirrosporium novae-zelandiae]
MLKESKMPQSDEMIPIPPPSKDDRRLFLFEPESKRIHASWKCTNLPGLEITNNGLTESHLASRDLLELCYLDFLKDLTKFMEAYQGCCVHSVFRLNEDDAYIVVIKGGTSVTKE